MKRLLLCCVVLIVAGSLMGQTYTSVPVDDPVYDFIDTMILRGIIRRDVMARPWPRSKVLSVLGNIQVQKNRLSEIESEYLDSLIDRIDLTIEKTFAESGAIDIPSELFPAQFGLRWKNDLNLGLSDTTMFGGTFFFDGYIHGDVPGPISYSMNVSAGLISVTDFNAYEPYTYTKVWDGAPYHLIGYAPYGFPSELSGSLEIQSEIALSVWDDQFWTRFARIRRDWGSFGSGNLFLSSTARPFTAIDLTFNPWKWFSFSAMTGSLDYGVHISNENGSYPVPGDPTPPEDVQPVYSRGKEAAQVEQNSFSILLFEIMPTERFYISIFDAVVWPKRYELDYIYPFQSKFFGQEVVGDFDNMMIGGTFAFLAPEYGQAWFSFYIDEMDPTESNFFAQDRNMYAYQLGTTIPVSLFGLGKINLQYTKIEPYTYTHPPVNAPTYNDVDSDGDVFDMQTYYLNNGEALGFYQPPNSDELRLDISTMPITNLMTFFKYRMIRHGATHGSYRVDGSSYYDYINYYNYAADGGTYPKWNDDPLYRKNFLRDGAYEWQHVFGIGADWYFSIGSMPARLGLEYNFVWKYYTLYSYSQFRIYEDAEYQSSITNIINLKFILFP